jgi:magnesium-transporting ATPase (P-type)
MIRDAIVWNCDARIEMSDDAFYVPQGNGTEIGLLKLLSDNEIAVQDLFAEKSRQCVIETSIPFDSTRKRQIVAIRPSREADYVRVIVKGAPEYVLPMCTKQLGREGDEELLSEEQSESILRNEIIQKMAKQFGLRTLAFAYRDFPEDEWQSLKEQNNNFLL